RMQIAWEGMTFSGLPVKFISDRQIKEGKLSNFKIVAVNAKHVDDFTFNALIDFAAKGGTLLCQGDDALMLNEFGIRVPEREKKLQIASRVAADFARNWFSAFENALSRHSIKPPIDVVGLDGQHIYGLEYRCAKDRDGKDLMYIVNFSKKPVIATIKGKNDWFDLITMSDKPSRLTLKPLDVLLLKAK
ncbi:MAG: hypothetical protein J5833_03770, partial [Victivallales bacterium]|nr:hypothetical protein [Victivallales bacterium]